MTFRKVLSCREMESGRQRGKSIMSEEVTFGYYRLCYYL